MGCTASTAITPIGIAVPDDNAIGEPILSNLHHELTQDEPSVSKIQDMILTLSKSQRSHLTTAYNAAYKSSLLEAIHSKCKNNAMFWEVLLEQDPYLAQLQSVLMSPSADPSLVLDVLFSCPDRSTLKDAYQEGTGCMLQDVLKERLSDSDYGLITLVTLGEEGVQNGGDVTSGDNSTVRENIALYSKDKVAYFAHRVRRCVATDNARGALFIVLSRVEVDLESISARYTSQYSRNLWDDLNSILSEPVGHLNLLEQTHKVISDPEDEEDGHLPTSTEVGTASPSKKEEVGHVARNILKERVTNIHVIMTSSELDGAALNTALLPHTDQIHALYSDMYNQDLLTVLKEKISTEHHTVIQALCKPYHKSSATLLQSAIECNDGSTVDLVLMVLLCSNTQQIGDISRAFQTLSDKEETLNSVMSSNLQGEFQRFVSALLKGERSTKTEVDETLAKEDAVKLHQATEFTWDAEDSVFNDVFLARSVPQLRATFSCFEAESGSDITELILTEFSLHLQKALLNLVYIANNGIPKFLAKFVNESKTKSHFSSILCWVVASRLQLDFSSTKEEFSTKYEASMSSLLEYTNMDLLTSTLVDMIIRGN